MDVPARVCGDRPSAREARVLDATRGRRLALSHARLCMQDSGNLIPGHGGLLDRFDSYIFSGALGYFYITALLPRLGLA